MLNNRLRSIAACALLGFAASLPAGCAAGGPGDPSREFTSFTSASAGVEALVGEWTVFELDERSIDGQMHDAEARKPAMSIRPDGTAGGFSGVNQFGSQLKADALTRGRFELGPIAMTRMAGPPEMMSIESRLTLALSEARRFSLRDNVLTLMPAEGRADPLVRFRREFGTSSKGPGAPKP